MLKCLSLFFFFFPFLEAILDNYFTLHEMQPLTFVNCLHLFQASKDIAANKQAVA